jgi:hypothetical protein
MSRLRLLSPLFLACSAPLAPAQIVVLSGDSLVDAVAAAPNGETIIIQSDDTFVGTLAIAGKSVTIEAGVGYAPAVQGSPGSIALTLSASDPAAGATLRGLRLVPGDGPDPSLFALSTAGTGLPPVELRLDLEDCVVEGGISVSGTGEIDGRLDLDRTVVSGTLSVGGTGSATNLVTVDDSWLGGLSVASTGDATTDVVLKDTDVAGPVSVTAQSSADVLATFARCRIDGEVFTSQVSPATAVVFLDSCLVVGDGTGIGLEARDGARLDAVCTTVTGFALGAATELPSALENLALFGNGQSLDPVVIAQQISSSLIEDGTYHGFGGNFGGTPLVDGDFRLLPGSIGIDAGNSTATSMGSIDLAGDPRVQDSDGDGVARVNVGAFEGLGDACAAAGHQPLLGSGTNPFIYGVASDPALGTNFVGAITKGPATAGTLLLLGFAAPAPLTPGFLEGELLLQIAPLPVLHFANGLHVLPVPNDPNLCGVTLDTQGLRLDVDAVGALIVRAGNGQRLQLGH